MAGGADFNVFILPGEACATVHITYIFTDARCRNAGIGPSLLQHIESAARRWVANQGFPLGYPLHVFWKQNEPERMNPENTAGTRKPLASTLANGSSGGSRKVSGDWTPSTSSLLFRLRG